MWHVALLFLEHAYTYLIRINHLDPVNYFKLLYFKLLYCKFYSL